jgi:hypothetical protein
MGTKLKAFLQAFWAKLHADLDDLWQRDKGFLLVFGAIILALKFNRILINLIVASSKSLFNSTVASTTQVQNQENTDNNQANQLVDNSNNLPGNETTITDDWNTTNGK